MPLLPSIARLSRTTVCALAPVLLAVLTPAASAQCLSWETFPYTPASAPSAVTSAITWDDGTGPATYLTLAGPVGGSVVQRWNGSVMTPVGNGVTGNAFCLADITVAGVRSLYVGGNIGVGSQPGVLVARWDGTTWQPIATTSQTASTAVLALTSYDDGSGPRLYACGRFTEIFGTSFARIARWDGTSWSPLGQGLTSSFGARSLAVYDEGAGPRLFVCGPFTAADGLPLRGLARWDGSTFSDVGGFSNTAAQDLVVHDDGAGPALVVVGTFQSVAAQPAGGAASWRGGAWTVLGTLATAAAGTDVGAVARHDDGSGPALHATTRTQGKSRVKRWNGATWDTVGSDLLGACKGSTLATPSFLESVPTPAGNRLHVSGGFETMDGGVASKVVRLEGADWAQGFAPEAGIDPATRVRALASFDDGSGPALYAGGGFCRIGGITSSYLARLRQGEWEDVGLPTWENPDPSVSALGVFDLGTGPALYIGGHFALPSTTYQPRGIARWDGTSLHSLANGLFGGLQRANAFAVADLGQGPRLYVGGSFVYAGNEYSSAFAAWDGTAWHAQPQPPVGAFVNGLAGEVFALSAFDDGSGVAVYVGGSFLSQYNNPTPLMRIARWDGANFTPVGAGMDDHVLALATFDDGSGPKLYAAGAFTIGGGIPALRVARFDGTTWTPVGAGFDGLVTALAVYDDGSGQALYAAGNFSNSGATPVSGVARWNGSSWTSLGNGVAPSVSALAVHADVAGEPAKLYVGGVLETAGTLATSNLAAWRGCGGTIDRFCFGDGTTSPCPCGNSGLAFRGCNNSANSLGARLNATGAANPDTIELYVAGETPSAATLVFQGNVLLSTPQPFGDGLRCVSGSLKRMYTTNAVSGSLAVPAIGQPSVSTRSAQLGDPLAPGDVRGYQAWYRDVNPSFCAPPNGANWNLSNALRIVW